MAARDPAETGMVRGVLLEGVQHGQELGTRQRWKTLGHQGLAAQTAEQHAHRTHAPVDGVRCRVPQPMAQGAGTAKESDARSTVTTLRQRLRSQEHDEVLTG